MADKAKPAHKTCEGRLSATRWANQTQDDNQPPFVTRSELVESVQHLVDYLYDDESEDYAQSGRDRQDEHIFSALQMLHRWLREQAVSADD